MAAAAVTVGDVRLTPQQLAGFDGSDSSKPLYIAVRGKIYDVSAGRSFYGPGADVWGFICVTQCFAVMFYQTCKQELSKSQ